MRVKRGFKARRRRNKVLKLAKGFRGGRGKLYRTASDSVDKAACMHTGIDGLARETSENFGSSGLMRLQE